MDSIVNLILNRSVVTVEHIKITKATPEYVLPLSNTSLQGVALEGTRLSSGIA